MTKRKLKKVFSDNINKEFESFISQMEEFKKSEIIACSYRIYIMQYIYEYLMRKQEDFSKEDLKILYEQASILKDIYWEWVKNNTTLFCNLIKLRIDKNVRWG